MVLLKCVREGRKLRIKITSDGFLNSANCNFPRDIREEGRLYYCPDSNVTLAKIGNTYFYRIFKNNIIIVDANFKEPLSKPDKVYTDETDPDCNICLTDAKSLIFVPCGHYAICNACDKRLVSRKCPICRAHIFSTITPEQMQ